MKDNEWRDSQQSNIQQAASLDASLDAWMEQNKTEQSKAPVFNPIVCSNYNANRHFSVLTQDGRIKFASKLMTMMILTDIKRDYMKYPDVLGDLDTFEMYSWEFPETVRRVRKQHKLVVNKEARFTETRLDFRSSNLPKFHPMNSICISHMYGWRDYVSTIKARVEVVDLLVDAKNWLEVFPEYNEALERVKDDFLENKPDFWEETKDWVVWELTTLPWGYHFDDIFTEETTEASKKFFPEDSGFFVK